MNVIEKLHHRFAGPPLTPRRIVLVVAVAALADALQLALVPLSWIFTQQIIDVIAMGLAMRLLGFHILLLPTFVIEFFPVVGMLPTWTGCVMAVIALRKRAENRAPNAPPIITVSPPPESPTTAPAQKRLSPPDAS